MGYVEVYLSMGIGTQMDCSKRFKIFTFHMISDQLACESEKQCQAYDFNYN